MAHQLRALVAFVEDLDLIPSITWELMSISNPIFSSFLRSSFLSVWPMMTLTPFLPNSPTPSPVCSTLSFLPFFFLFNDTTGPARASPLCEGSQPADMSSKNKDVPSLSNGFSVKGGCPGDRLPPLCQDSDWLGLVLATHSCWMFTCATAMLSLDSRISQCPSASSSFDTPPPTCSISKWLDIP